MIPFIGQEPSRQFQRDKRISSGRAGGHGDRKANGVSCWGDKNTLELGSDDGCLILEMHLKDMGGWNDSTADRAPTCLARR